MALFSAALGLAGLGGDAGGAGAACELSPVCIALRAPSMAREVKVHPRTARPRNSLGKDLMNYFNFVTADSATTIIVSHTPTSSEAQRHPPQ